MKVAYLDCFSGISGDMLLGTLVDAGWPLDELRKIVAGLGLPERIDLRVEDVHKGALRASSVFVDTEESHHHRHLSDILALIERAPLSERARSQASRVFQTLAEAEARVHGSTVDHVHFHEVGALDSIVDILGGVAGLEWLGIERLYASALPFGGGKVETQHGLLPVPAPATLEILSAAHAPLEPSPAQVELVTPTGAAILATLATFERPAMTLTGVVGIGAGKRELPWPNVARLIVGESAGGNEAQPLSMLETNVDDMNPELFGPVMAHLFEAGALDVFFTPIYMKKNRPATLLGVLARRADEPKLARILLAETTTFGLRVHPVYRYEAEREFSSVETPFGVIPVKIKKLDGKAVQAAPEFEACAKAAAEQHVNVAKVYTAALAAGQARLSD